jgi:RNA polymerase sigma-70 factor (family 1)
MKDYRQEELRILLDRLSENDKVSFCLLFNAYSPKVNAFALKLTLSRSLAEEIVQDVFMKIWINRKNAFTIDNFDAYLFTLVRHHSFNILKRLALEAKAKVILAKESPQYHRDLEEGLHLLESQQILKQVIDQLPPQQRLVYSLCYHEGLKYEEVAQRLNISRLTVKTHMQQALRNIRAHFTGFLN